MDWVNNLNSAVNYIEEHLEDSIDYEQLGKIAYCSSFHFQRMFAYMAGAPLSEYIRRRRMTRAAVDILGGQLIIDVALKYGYDSPTAFNRAFQSVHGMAPSCAKKQGAVLKAYPPMSFKIVIKGATDMDYRIEKKKEFRIVGISMPLDKDVEKNFAEVPKMWQKAMTDGTIAALCGYMDGSIKGVLGVSNCNAREDWKYYIAVDSSKPIAKPFEELIIPEATWAIFKGVGSGISIQELEKRIVTEWLPTSGYEYTDAPDVEVYFNEDPNNMQYEVWIPVKKKTN